MSIGDHTTSGQTYSSNIERDGTFVNGSLVEEQSKVTRKLDALPGKRPMIDVTSVGDSERIVGNPHLERAIV
jgi:hypothetical protein